MYGRQKRLTYLKPLCLKEADRLFHSFGTLLLFEMIGHIDLEQVNWIPRSPGGKYGINGGQTHSGNGNDSPFLTPALGNTLILQRIVGIRFVLHSSMGNLHQRGLRINTSA